ncbi:MAG: DUF4835 family protein, partial [Bacteroidia bacterium]
ANPDKALVADLQMAVFNFLNNKKWSDDKIQINEKIDCTFIINLKTQETDNFTATVEIQSSRPVFGSTYNSILFRHMDNWDFKYSLYLPLDFQENAYTSQLTSLLGFYANLILGLDYDSYAQDGGLNYFRKAQNIKNLAMNEYGWSIRDGKNGFNRWFLIENMMDERYKTIHNTFYLYHIKGMDIMYKDLDKGRISIIDGLTELKKIYNIYPNSFTLFLFFEAKSKELVKIYSKASPTQKNRAYELLVQLNPYNRNKYDEMLKAN